MSKVKGLSGVGIKVGLSAKELISAIRELDEEKREFLIENLLAATSPGYLESIKEARTDYKEGHVVPHNELFAK